MLAGQLSLFEYIRRFLDRHQLREQRYASARGGRSGRRMRASVTGQDE